MANGLTGLTDGALVERYLRGEDGLDVLYRRYSARLIAYCTRISGDRARGEDLAHDTVVRAMSRLHRFDRRRELWPWLKVMATRLAIDRARLTRRELALDLEELPIIAVEDDGEDRLGERDLLVRAFLRLPPRQQMAVAYRYLEDWDPSEIADVLGITRSAFEQLLYRARKRLCIEYRRVAKGTLVVLGPVVGAWRRLRGALERAQASVGEAMASQWTRFDPTAAVSAVMGTTTAALSVAAMVAVGGGGPGGTGGVVERPIGGIETAAALHPTTVESLLDAIPTTVAPTSASAAESGASGPTEASPSPSSDPAAPATATVAAVGPEARVDVAEEPVGKETSPDGEQHYGTQPIGAGADVGDIGGDPVGDGTGDPDEIITPELGPTRTNCPPPEERAEQGEPVVILCGTLDQLP